MKKMLLALAAIFAVAGVANMQADCGCKREPKPCPVACPKPVRTCPECPAAKLKPCPKKCERKSACQKCGKSKCGMCLFGTKSDDAAATSDDMMNSEDDMMVDMDENFDASKGKTVRAKATRRGAAAQPARRSVAERR